MVRLFSALALAASLVGCAAPPPKPLYHWDGYQAQVYEHFKGDGKSPQEQLSILEEQMQKAQGKGEALPPGFRGHLAMLYLKLGRNGEALQQLQAEKAAFPESAPYIDFLLKRMVASKS